MLRHEVGVSVRAKVVEDMRALTLRSYAKKSCVGAAEDVYKNKVIGGVRIASFLFMLYDMTEMASVNIKYQNV